MKRSRHESKNLTSLTTRTTGRDPCPCRTTPRGRASGPRGCPSPCARRAGRPRAVPQPRVCLGARPRAGLAPKPRRQPARRQRGGARVGAAQHALDRLDDVGVAARQRREARGRRRGLLLRRGLVGRVGRRRLGHDARDGAVGPDLAHDKVRVALAEHALDDLRLHGCHAHCFLGERHLFSLLVVHCNAMRSAARCNRLALPAAASMRVVWRAFAPQCTINDCLFALQQPVQLLAFASVLHAASTRQSSRGPVRLMGT